MLAILLGVSTFAALGWGVDEGLAEDPPPARPPVVARAQAASPPAAPSERRSAPPPAPARARPGATATTTPTATAPAAVGEPTSLRIPALGVDAVIAPVGLDAQRRLEVPADAGQVGWFRHGARPGARGPAVLVGHFDSREGPAVFYRLGALRPGQEITVGSGTARHRFVVDRLEWVGRDAFPTESVYGAVPRPELRLLTCAGWYDRDRGAYEQNLVVYAHAGSAHG